MINQPFLKMSCKFCSFYFPNLKWGMIWDLAFQGRNLKRSEQTQINLHHQGILGVWEFSTTFTSMQIEKDSFKMLSQNNFCLIEWNKCGGDKQVT